MKTKKIIFWTTTIIIFLIEGVMPVLTFHSELAKHEGFLHLGYPWYFGNTLIVFKAFGVLALIIPKIPGRIKEWAYAGFAFDFIFACISHCLVDGLFFKSFFPLMVMAILVVSYIFHHKINSSKINN